MRVLIAGCGDLGTRLGLLLCAAGHEVYGLRRQAARVTPPLRAVTADLLSGSGLESLPAGIDRLVYAVTPDRRDAEAYRAIYHDGLSRLLAALPCGAPAGGLLFVSSSSVFGQDGGEWVDESHPPQPTLATAQALLQAEDLARRAHSQACVLRLSGLYGPGRNWLLRRLQAGQPLAAGPHWTNRIHLEDAAALAALLLEHPRPPAVVIGVDDCPVPETEVLDWLAGQHGLPRLPRQAAAMQASGKRLSNALARSLGWRPRYPDYRAGHAACDLPMSSRSSDR